MPMYGVNNPAQRIGKLKGEMLAHAIPVEVLGVTGQQKQIPKNVGQTVVYRRYIPYGAALTNANTINRWAVDPAAHILQEGVTPPADSLVPQDVSVSLQQYGCLYSLSDRTADLNEDDVPAEMKEQCGERVALLREMVRWGILKGGTNAYYAGGTSRSTVAAKLTLGLLRKISRNLQANHAKRVRGILEPSTAISTRYVEASYLVFAHTDCESDIRDIAGFVPVAAYGSRQTVSDYEIGSVENFRFILSPELAPIPDAGAAIGTTGLYTTTGTSIDVYPIVMTGQDSWGQVALRGVNALDPTYLPPGEKTKDDPLGQKGFVGAKFYFNATLLNNGWMAVAEAGVTAL